MTTTAGHRFARALAMSLALSVLLPFYSPAGASSTDPSASDRVLVVTANLREAYGFWDVAHHGDMKVFVRRLTDQVPSAPDVLLLQEVVHASSTWVARHLSDKTGFHYAVKVDPGRQAVRDSAKRIHDRETAILINTDTMSALSSGRYVGTSALRSEVTAGKYVAVKDQATMLVQERASGDKYALASVHLSPPGGFISHAIEKAARARWVDKITGFMAKHYQGAAFSTIGGDFNSSRCLSGGGNCAEAPFYKLITGALGYTNSVQAAGAGGGGVDFVFTKAGTYKAGVDSSYNRRTTSNFYSDHQFRWSVLGPDTVAPSAPSGLRLRDKRPNVSLSWSASSDPGGSGVAYYEIYRTGLKGDFRLIKTTSNNGWLDKGTFHTHTYQYYVVAYDGAHNASPRSDSKRITI